MARTILLTLLRRGVTAHAELLEASAPATCAAVLRALPIEGPVWHTKTAGNEIFTLLPSLADGLPPENANVIPIPGDLLHFELPARLYPPTDPRRIDVGDAATQSCLASFYDRNSIHWMELGFLAGSRWGHIVEGLEAWQAACHDVWRQGWAGERLRIEAGER